MKETVKDAKDTPAMRQWRDMKALHPDKIILFRMGDFYEMFHEDAVRASALLGLTLTKRGKDREAPPLAGVPHHQLDRYVRELIEKGENVVVVDQLEEASQAKGVVRRGITRVETPGTLVDAEALPVKGNNYLAAATLRGDIAAVAFVDISTGDFVISLPPARSLADEFARQSPAETLVSRETMNDGESPLARLLAAGLGGRVTRRDAYQFDPHEGEARLKSQFGVDTLAGYGLEGLPQAIGVAGTVLAYLEENQAARLGHLRPPRLATDDGFLKLDRNTIRNLELAPAARGRGGNTLLDVLDHTRTGPGGRLLRRRLLLPSARLDEICHRQAAAAELMADPERRDRLRTLLAGMADVERIMARVATQRATPRDLAALAASCRALPEVVAFAEECEAELIRDCAELDTLADVADLIEDAILPDPPAGVKDGGIIRPGHHAEVDELRDVKNGGRDWMAKYQAAEQARTGIPSLKVGFNQVFGFYIEITNTHRDKAPPEYVRKQTLVNAERYITSELKTHEEKVLGAEEKLFKLEFDLFCAVRDRVAAAASRVQAAADVTAELDVAASLAEAGVRGRYVVPEMHEGLETMIVDGRHPVVETLLPAGEFVANDIEFTPDSQRILIITGPNMAGKSTYIRQAALIFIMAHMGSPVPAASARIGLADRVFTRVGASDDLARGLSTFMVEMVETAEILHNATERSLIILDEVGRGTSTFDGVSLAWAITEYLHQSARARTLFATHYHELAELGHILDRAKNFNVAVREWQDRVVFLRKIQSGACDRSYGIQVGRLAGIPPAVVKRATEILKGLEEQASERDWKMLQDSRELLRAAARDVQLELFAPPRKLDEVAREITLELSKIDINHLSPLEAHTVLGKLSDKSRRG